MYRFSERHLTSSREIFISFWSVIRLWIIYYFSYKANFVCKNLSSLNKTFKTKKSNSMGMRFSTCLYGSFWLANTWRFHVCYDRLTEGNGSPTGSRLLRQEALNHMNDQDCYTLYQGDGFDYYEGTLYSILLVLKFRKTANFLKVQFTWTALIQGNFSDTILSF